MSNKNSKDRSPPVAGNSNNPQNRSYLSVDKSAAATATNPVYGNATAVKKRKEKPTKKLPSVGKSSDPPPVLYASPVRKKCDMRKSPRSRGQDMLQTLSPGIERLKLGPDLSCQSRNTRSSAFMSGNDSLKSSNGQLVFDDDEEDNRKPPAKNEGSYISAVSAKVV